MPTNQASTKPLTLSRLVRQIAAQAAQLYSELENQEQAQAMACAAPILAAAGANIELPLHWLSQQLSSWEQAALTHARVLSTQYSILCTKSSPHNTNHHPTNAPPTPISSANSLPLPLRPSPTPPLSPSHLYESVLHQLYPAKRIHRGVFFTPEPIAHYILKRIDNALRNHFTLPHGLATQSPIPNPQSAIPNPQSAIPAFLDPACGTGIFLLELIGHAHRQVPPDRWNAFVPDLLSRLVGIEILPAAAFLAKLNITLKLAQTGFDFSTPCQLQIHTADALTPETQSKIQNPKSKIPILLGNPPFSSLSASANPWITELVRGNDEIRGYIRAGGQSLGERKTWLHDDYVKFIRLAQWHVENAGAGIMAFVTNHGYLDNATFRLMRHELIRVFPHIEILDLHGNRKKHETSPDGSPDENVFHLDQGLAIGLFCRAPRDADSPLETRSVSKGNPPTQIEYSELWGTRDSKLNHLSHAPPSPSPPHPLSPSAPNFLLIPNRHTATHPEYTSAWSLADAMPVNTTAPVTARDHFVVGFTRAELEQRIAEFRDLTIPDDEIRQRYFHRTRSARYRSGDTRGWKLAEARRTIAADDHWHEKIIRCLYRPFDWRYIFWHPAMIDWPRTEVTRHLISRPPSPEPRAPLCLIARRQQLPGHPCTFFWVSDGLALDGVIRSDNRGSESLFPLYVDQVAGTLRVPKANFAHAFINQFAQATDLAWQPQGPGNLTTTFGPEDVLAYIYALFHAPTYRESYAPELRSGFPRIIPPRNATQFRQMAQFGQELIRLHLLHDEVGISANPLPGTLPGTPYSVLSTQYSVLNTQSASPDTPSSPSQIHSFRAGGYEPLKKWLQPKHRTAADPAYAQIAAAIARTQEIMAMIDLIFTAQPDS